MNVCTVVVHELVKEIGNTAAQLHESSEVMSINKDVEKLIRELSSRYRRRKITYARFGREENKVFPSEFDRWSISRAEIDFVNFTVKAARDLRSNIEGIAAARGGYVVFAYYRDGDRSFFAVFILRNTSTAIFKRDKQSGNYALDHAVHLDVEDLAMACRIDMEMHWDDSGKYLSFIQRGKSDISEYFLRWLSAQELEDNKMYTEELYRLISELPAPLDENGRDLDLDDFRKGVYQIVSASPTKTIDLRSLSQHFYDDPEFIPEFVEKHGIVINTEFRADASSLKKFVQVKVKADGLTLEFSRGDRNTKVRFSEDDDSLVLISSKAFANALRDELYGSAN